MQVYTFSEALEKIIDRLYEEPFAEELKKAVDFIWISNEQDAGCTALLHQEWSRALPFTEKQTTIDFWNDVNEFFNSFEYDYSDAEFQKKLELTKQFFAELREWFSEWAIQVTQMELPIQEAEDLDLE